LKEGCLKLQPEADHIPLDRPKLSFDLDWAADQPEEVSALIRA